MENAGHLPTCTVLVLTLLSAACGDCPDRFELNGQAEMRPDQRIDLIVPHGELDVVGRERSALVEVVARGCRARGGARIDRSSTDSVHTMTVVAPRADVRVRVPAGAAIDIRHGSGRVELRALGPTSLVTRGGVVRLEQVVGGVRVQAGAGTLYVREIVGDVDVIDGPGAMFVEGVMGAVRVRDGSGGIHLREIDGDVVVEADGSGSIDARTIGGSLVVRAKSDDPRMVRWNDVAGGVSLPERH